MVVLAALRQMQQGERLPLAYGLNPAMLDRALVSVACCYAGLLCITADQQWGMPTDILLLECLDVAGLAEEMGCADAEAALEDQLHAVCNRSSSALIMLQNHGVSPDTSSTCATGQVQQSFSTLQQWHYLTICHQVFDMYGDIQRLRTFPDQEAAAVQFSNASAAARVR
jgi:hypothetical protein